MALKDKENNSAKIINKEAPTRKSWLWLTDTKGHQSVSLTFAAVSFIVTTFSYIASIIQNVGPITFRSFDVGACGAYFGTIMALYFGRKFTEAKFNNGGEK